MSQDYKKILVAVDGSKEANAAFKKAVQISLDNNAQLDVLNVLDTKQYIGSFSGGIVNGDVLFEVSQDAQSYLNDLRKDALNAGVDVKNIHIHIRYGNPKTVISYDFVKEYKNDLIMVGSTGLGTIGRIFIGSVSEYVTRNAPVDVMIVRDNKEK